MGELVTEFILLQNRTSNGYDKIIEWTGRGPATLHIEGTWDSATVTMSEKPKIGSTYVSPSTNYAFTADTAIEFEAGRVLVKATISSAGSNTSLSAYIIPSY